VAPTPRRLPAGRDRHADAPCFDLSAGGPTTTARTRHSTTNPTSSTAPATSSPAGGPTATTSPPAAEGPVAVGTDKRWRPVPTTAATSSSILVWRACLPDSASSFADAAHTRRPRRTNPFRISRCREQPTATQPTFRGQQARKDLHSPTEGPSGPIVSCARTVMLRNGQGSSYAEVLPGEGSRASQLAVIPRAHAHRVDPYHDAAVHHDLDERLHVLVVRAVVALEHADRRRPILVGSGVSMR